MSDHWQCSFIPPRKPDQGSLTFTFPSSGYSWCVPKILLGRIKNKNKTPTHQHYSVVSIWNPLWSSIQDPHVSSLHMNTTKRETPLPSQSVEKTETRCNTHTGSALLIAVAVCVHEYTFNWRWRTCQSTKVTFTLPSACKYWKMWQSMPVKTD